MLIPKKKLFFDLDLPGVLGLYLPQGQLFAKKYYEIRNQREKLNQKTYLSYKKSKIFMR